MQKLTPLAFIAALAAAPNHLGGPEPDPATLPPARVQVDADRHELVIELAPTDLPAGASHDGAEQPPVALAEVPLSGALYGFRTELVDSAGRLLPAELLHHFNLIDPGHRELFLPISRRVIAAGKETGAQRIPWLLFGAPIARGQKLIASAMLHNPTGASYRQVRTRLVLAFVPDGRPWPLFRAYPWQLDVAFPVGDKSFDLPPGRSLHSWEGRPALPGRIIALGGHMHEHGVSIELSDAMTGEVIWRAAPVVDSSGKLLGVPVGRLYGWNRLGARIDPNHTYRVTVVYENPTGRVLPGGGMGVVGGLFVPDRGTEWPVADPSDPLYQADLAHAMRVHWQRRPAAPAQHHSH